jgi:PPOX class probable F420-dependent enzyme
MSAALPDPTTPFGQRVTERLRDEPTAWLTTVGADGTPQPNPVWFLWDGESILIYTLNDAKRLEHIKRNPRVAFHFNSDDAGNDVVVITGDARITTGEPPASQNPAYLAKYAARIERTFSDEPDWAEHYAVTMRVTPTRVRGF